MSVVEPHAKPTKYGSRRSGCAFEWPISSLRNTWYVPARGVPRRPLTGNIATT